MNSLSALPLPFQVIIKDYLPRAMKAYSTQKEKERGLLALRNHKEARTVPNSLKFKTHLIIPDYLKQTTDDVVLNKASEQRFNQLMEAFQAAAMDEMIAVTERATKTLGESLQAIHTKVATEISLLYHTFLTLKGLTNDADSLKANMANYPNVTPIAGSSTAVCLQYIAVWQSEYDQALNVKLLQEANSKIAKDKKVAARVAAEDVMMTDNSNGNGNGNNELVRDLVRKELQPIKKQVERLNSTKAEKGRSADDSKPSKPPSKQPAPARNPKGQAGGKGNKGGTKQPPKQEGKKGNKGNQQQQPKKQQQQQGNRK